MTTPLDSTGSSGGQERKIQTKGRDTKQNFVWPDCKSLRPGMVGNEIGERDWILEGLEFCSKELVCRREGPPEISQLGKNQEQVVI